MSFVSLEVTTFLCSFLKNIFAQYSLLDKCSFLSVMVPCGRTSLSCSQLKQWHSRFSLGSYFTFLCPKVFYAYFSFHPTEYVKKHVFKGRDLINESKITASSGTFLNKNALRPPLRRWWWIIQWLLVWIGATAWILVKETAVLPLLSLVILPYLQVWSCQKIKIKSYYYEYKFDLPVPLSLKDLLLSERGSHSENNW